MSGLGLIQRLFALLCVVMLASHPVALAEEEEEGDPPEVTIGERLFLETRFAQFFFANCNGDVNAVLAQGDPVMATLETVNGPIPSPFVGQSMNCRQCHLVDDAKFTPGGGNRTYSDFARRSPIPLRNDGLTHTARNSPPLVNAQLPRKNGFFLHFDAEFATVKDLVKATLTGRNYGWLATERAQAVKHIASVIRRDNGTGDNAKAFGGPYRYIIGKTSAQGLSEDFALDGEFRLDLAHASDEQILDVVAALVAEYLKSLSFSTDEAGNFNASAFDLFLRRNKLPLKPRGRETGVVYGRKLLKALEALPSPQFVTPADGTLLLHNGQSFAFGPDELAGLKIFLSEPSVSPLSSTGNCVACHAPPTFTDFSFHNTGATQDEYDSIHGDGAFATLSIPNQTERSANPAAFLPPTEKNPTGTGRFAAIPVLSDPSKVDLGVWNVIGNADQPFVQKFLTRALLRSGEKRVAVETLVDRSVAVFKTPGLRDLGHSAPYFHTGRSDTLEQAVEFYARFSQLTRDGKVRNPDENIGKISITPADVQLLAKFLRSLNEDYE